MANLHMKALVKREDAPGLWLEEVPRPVTGARDVLIKIDRTGICGTDLHIYKWDDWARKTVPLPLVVGHEFVGEIVEIGSDVKDFSVGEIVSGEGHVVCGHCRNCMAGRRHLCSSSSQDEQAARQPLFMNAGFLAHSPCCAHCTQSGLLSTHAGSSAGASSGRTVSASHVSDAISVADAMSRPLLIRVT